MLRLPFRAWLLPGVIPFFFSAAYLFTAASHAGEIAVSLPLSGDAAEIGKNFRIGVKLAKEVRGYSHNLFISDDGCDADLADISASDIAERSPDVVIGMLCNDAAKAVATKMAGSKKPIIVSGARSVRLIKDRTREQWDLWRFSPGDDYPAIAAAEAIETLWKNTAYAIIDDGTIYGRNFTDTLRALMEERGLQPQFVDTFRAAQSTQAGLLRRLQRSGVNAVFIASSSTDDLMTIARNMTDLDIKLDMIASEALASLPFLEDAQSVAPGIKIIAPFEPAMPELDALLDEREIGKEHQIYMGFAAMEVADQIIGYGGTGIIGRRFSTILGDFEFSADGTSTYNPYKLQEWNGGELQKPDALKVKTQ